jgi:HSP20 family protein
MALPVLREADTALARIHDEIDRMFHEFSLPGYFAAWPERPRRWAPAIDLYEEGNTLVVEAELPGIPKEAVKITCSDHTLTIQGETKKEEEEKREGYYRAERRYGNFFRAVTLPESVDTDKATAQFRDGVLRVALPKKAKPEEKGRTIPISG